jgi:hypothetical protein
MRLEIKLSFDHIIIVTKQNPSTWASSSKMEQPYLEDRLPTCVVVQGKREGRGVRAPQQSAVKLTDCWPKLIRKLDVITDRAC